MKIKKGVILQKMGEISVAYDNKTGTLHELNETAFDILQAIEKGLTQEKIVKLLMKNYEVSRDKAEKDYKSFLKVLVKKDLITRK